MKPRRLLRLTIVSSSRTAGATAFGCADERGRSRDRLHGWPERGRPGREGCRRIVAGRRGRAREVGPCRAPPCRAPGRLAPATRSGCASGGSDLDRVVDEHALHRPAERAPAAWRTSRGTPAGRRRRSPARARCAPRPRSRRRRRRPRRSSRLAATRGLRPDVRRPRRVGSAVDEQLAVQPQEPDRRGLRLAVRRHGREPEDRLALEALEGAGAGLRRRVDHRGPPSEIGAGWAAPRARPGGGPGGRRRRRRSGPRRPP